MSRVFVLLAVGAVKDVATQGAICEAFVLVSHFVREERCSQPCLKTGNKGGANVSEMSKMRVKVKEYEQLLDV